jgi:glycosyltransferase involved in cell wall biosynthesis
MTEGTAIGDRKEIYVDVAPLSSKHLTGIGRYTARLVLVWAKRGGVRLFEGPNEVIPPPRLSWDQDQDLARWAKRLLRGRRIPLNQGPNSFGIHNCHRPGYRQFGIEGTVIHDLTPILLPETHTPRTIADFQKLFARNLLAADFLMADSHSTRADAAWLCDVPESRVHVGYPGASLCLERHLHTDAVERQRNVGIVVATLEPRKNARFLMDWFAESDAVPEGSELWWVGATGWHTSRRELLPRRLRNGRKVRLLGFVDDRTLCRLYQSAGWMVYPSLYEGFGFPVLDALRHGIPVLCSGNSSLREFAGPGIDFFDPLDPASLDRSFHRLQLGRIAAPPPVEVLDQRFSWSTLVDRFLSAHQALTTDLTARVAGEPRAA